MRGKLGRSYRAHRCLARWRQRYLAQHLGSTTEVEQTLQLYRTVMRSVHIEPVICRAASRDSDLRLRRMKENIINQLTT